MIRILMLFGFLGTGLATAAATGWDARTTLTNTAVSGADVQQALNAGISPAFMQTFPVSQFGIHVQVGRHKDQSITRDFGYAEVELSSRLLNGNYRQAERVLLA